MFHQALTTGDHFRKMILCKVAKGKSLQTTANMDTLTGAPDGYHSVSLVGKQTSFAFLLSIFRTWMHRAACLVRSSRLLSQNLRLAN
jgi:hypothetical protein